MLETIKLENQPDNVQAFRIQGKIREVDVKKAISEIEPKLNSDKKVNFYVEMDAVESIEPEALMRDFQFAASNFNTIFKKTDKVALVTNQEWAKNLFEGVYKLIPGIELKSFEIHENTKAQEWIR